MHPDITLALAEARIADLHRAAARHRRTHARGHGVQLTTPRSHAGGWARQAVTTVRLATAARIAGGVAGRVRAATGARAGDPACCPA